MGAGNQAKHRQEGRSLRRKAATRKSADRILIICEGSKTEPQYLDEIRKEQRLPTAYVYVIGAAEGNDPLSIVNYAEKLFVNGDPHRGLEPQTFDQIVVVFDRDDHHSYHSALSRATKLHLSMKNNIKIKVPFEVCSSVPCFELWLLLHYESVLAPVHRTVVYQRLKQHIGGYEKGDQGLWKRTKEHLATASARASHLAKKTSRTNDDGPYTDIHVLVDRLLHLTKQPA
jgi:hypothetical protein